MIKVAIDTGLLKTGDKVRGRGVHTKQLIKGLTKYKADDHMFAAVDFSKVDLGKYDIAHYQLFTPFFLNLPSNFPTKAIVTIHDLISLIYLKHYPPGLKGKWRFQEQKKRVRNADAIITISETSKKDISRFLGVIEDKIYVIHLAPKDSFRKIRNEKKLELVRKKYNLPNNFVLYVGDINYNKNIPTLINACKMANATLVISGKQALDIEEQVSDLGNLRGPKDWLRYVLGESHPELAHYDELRSEFKNNSKIMRLGFVPDEDLVVLYNLARVYVQPSFYEGFGFPILEAMASGCPVVASRVQAHVEIAQGAAIFVDPKNPKEMSKKISQLIKHPESAKKQVSDGIRLSASYSWDKVAKETIKVYKKILND